ncbi:MAG: hypothetical protein COB40_03785 [Marinosulfonomonas sp.]|nr:MAG: hypothetical protein COB40_03785 [Marinosulfonomonas sp.]
MATTSSANRVVQIGNTTGVTMTHFFASNTSRDSWEEDIFGSDVLPSGRSMNIDIDDGSGACMFDLKARFADGDEIIERGYNVCTRSTWTVG